MFCRLHFQNVSNFRTVINEVSSVPISDFENTLSFPCEETSLGSGLPSHLLLGDVPCPSSPTHGFLHHIIGTLKTQCETCHHSFGIDSF
jgi:hypothetical protein